MRLDNMAPLPLAIARDATLLTFSGPARRRAMIYILAVFLPPLALLLNGQILSAVLNLVIVVPCIVFGLLIHPLFFVPSLHAVIAIYMDRKDRQHREIVEAIRQHGPPPGGRI
jgi:hypothetical protein